MTSSQLQYPQTARIQVSTDLHLLTQVLAWFNQFYPPSVPQLIWLQCELALAEGFTNAVRHAHSGKPPETPIEIEVTLKHQSIELRIWDYGPGFDLEKQLHTLPEPAAQETGGGRGLKIIQQTANQVSYKAVGNQQNCLLIVKNYTL